MIRIIEGFDFVGKSAVIQNYCNGFAYYHADYSVFDKYFNRDMAFMFGYGQFDLLSQVGKHIITTDIVMDRAVASSYVYSRLYINQEEVPNDLIEHYITLIDNFDERVEFVHASHIDKDSAKRIYDNDKSHNDILDQFCDFEDYWYHYIRAEELYEEFYTKFGISPTRFVTKSNENGSKVELIKL